MLNAPPEPMYDTAITYKYIHLIDELKCDKMSLEDFEKFVRPLEVNLVSYVLLERRFLNKDYLASETLDYYINQYKSKNVDLDYNAILPLIDIFYYNCNGVQRCVQSEITPLLGDLKITRNAACMFGMPSKCGQSDAERNFFFVNDETLYGLSNHQFLSKRRADFICVRYDDCK